MQVQMGDVAGGVDGGKACGIQQGVRRPPHKFGWKAKLMAILRDPIAIHSTRNKTVGYETQEKRRTAMFQFFGELRALGFKIEDPKNFANKHVHALCLDWEARELAPRTIVNRISLMRWFCSLIGKDGMIGAPEDYVLNPESVKFQRAAVVDKSWDANGLDVGEVIAKVSAFDQAVGNQLLACHGLGLRVREAVCFRPHVADRGTDLYVESGTKNGRVRVFPITPKMREVLDELKRRVPGKVDFLGSHGNLEQTVRRFYTVMERFEITKAKTGTSAHGLRAGFLNDKHEELTGVATPVRGGMPGDCPADVKLLADKLVAEAAGHSRISVTASYCGSHQAMAKKRAKEAAEAARAKGKKNLDASAGGEPSGEPAAGGGTGIQDDGQLMGKTPGKEVEDKQHGE